MPEQPPQPPVGTRSAGRRLWFSIVEQFDLEEHELALLVQAVRTVDLLNRLDALVERDGLTSESSQGTRAHPALAEARQQRIVLARLLSALRVPTSTAESRTRPSPGVRGFYALQGGAS